MNVHKQIAKAIKRADRSYFFENYDKQARCVVEALEKEGFIILPKEPDKTVLKQAADRMPTGRMKPEEHVRNVYQTLSALMAKH